MLNCVFVIIVVFLLIVYCKNDVWKWKPVCTFRRNNIFDLKSNITNIKHNIMILMLCTSNYDNVCNNSIHQVLIYCKLHNYKFKLFRNKLNNNLHINFSKFEMVKQSMIDYPYV